jgi:catechol 1,2-dioxygenase
MQDQDKSAGIVRAVAGIDAAITARLKVSAPVRELQTAQLYFPGGPHNADDIATAVKPELMLEVRPARQRPGQRNQPRLHARPRGVGAPPGIGRTRHPPRCRRPPGPLSNGRPGASQGDVMSANGNNAYKVGMPSRR